MADKTIIMREAQKYLAKGQIDKAISEWEKLLKEAPDGNTYNTIGDLYLKKGDKKSALESFHKAAGFFRSEGFMLKALALYKKVLNINAGDFGAIYALGQLSEEKGLATDAIKYYLAAADSLVKEGKKEQTVEIYEKILSLSPSNVPLRARIADMYLKEGLKSSAAREHVAIAVIYSEKGENEKALESYRRALDIQPLNRDASLGMGNIYEISGRMDEALSHMRGAAVLFHQDYEILLKFAELSYVAGLTDEAVETLLKITDSEPSYYRAGMLLGDIHMARGEREEAWAKYLPAIDEMIMQERYPDAIAHLERFRDFDPLETTKRLVSLHRQLGRDELTNAELVNLGDALFDRELREDALSAYREALQMKPDDERIRSRIQAAEQTISGDSGSPEVSAETPEIEASDRPVDVDPGEEVPVFESHMHSAPEPEHPAYEGCESDEELGTEDSEDRKGVKEILAEADVLAKYGLPGEALKLIEPLRLRDPRNVELHIKLKALYIEISEKESAVTECLILSELYKRSGDAENSGRMLNEAYELSPGDPRLAERGFAAPPSKAGQPSIAEGADTAAAPDMEDYREELAEADFYAKQGLLQESQKLLEKLHSLFPDNSEIREKLEALGQLREQPEPEEPKPEAQDPETADSFETVAAAEGEDLLPSEPGKQEFEDFLLTDSDLVDAAEMPEPKLDDDVMEIFQEFKKGLEKELGDQDSETHYNLGIAYKEMGLIDDAIKEFQAAREDPKRSVASSTMLGVCYMEKGLFPLAIEVLEKAVAGLQKGEDSYWAVRYDLGEAYEKSERFTDALEIYTEVYGWNARFRNVSEKITSLRELASPPSTAPRQEKARTRRDRVSYL